MTVRASIEDMSVHFPSTVKLYKLLLNWESYFNDCVVTIEYLCFVFSKRLINQTYETIDEYHLNITYFFDEKNSMLIILHQYIFSKKIDTECQIMLGTPDLSFISDKN